MHADLWVVNPNREDEDLLELNNPRAPKFKKFLGAFGWLDPQGDAVAAQHAVVVGGLQPDDRFMVLDEHSGDMPEIISSAIRLKDQYIVSEFWADATDTDLMMPIWEADGLTRYNSLGIDPVGREIWVSPDSAWPNFRNRETVATICNVPLSLRASISGGLNRLVALTRSGKLMVHSRCANVQWVLDQPKPSDVANHPVFKALVYLIYGSQRLLQELVSVPRDAAASGRPYQNLKKRR